ncbi:hypothetical protein V2J09_001966 [Rumex salicifolius]
MDFGLIEMENLVGQQHQQQEGDQNGKRKLCRSGFLKQEGSGSGSSGEDEISRASKITRNGHDLGLHKQMSLLRSAASCDGGSHHPQMLSFSSPTSEVNFLSTDGGGGGGGGGGRGGDKSVQSLPLSYYQQSPAPVYPKNAGYASGSMHGSFTGIRGPFTPAQWIELEHQALIYKYLTANVPVPATLLVPIKKALISSGYSGFSAGSFPSHSYGWGPFHLGYANSTDPEPGRCRRTDGKKWRCSRDAVPDQKYCERHINRGRHRSRKPVEGQIGQAASGPTNPKVGPTSSSTTVSMSSSGAPNLVTDTVVNRLQGSHGFSMMPTSSKDAAFAIPKHVPYEATPQPDFGFVSSESLLNPSSKPSPYVNCNKNYNSFFDFNDQQTQNHHLINNESLSSHSTIPWPEDLKPDWTQLSMSIPMSELSSSSSNQDKVALSPLRLSREPDQTQMGSGVGSEPGSKNGMWVPISWGSSIGGPLGEVVLNNNAGNEGWDGSPQLSSSPTGILQKGASLSLSNSGSGDENKTTVEEACIGDDDDDEDNLLGSAHDASSSIPAL